MARGVPEDRPMRWMQCVFAAPVPAGDVQVEAETLREGRSATVRTARVLAEGVTRVTMTAGFGTSRASSLSHDPPSAPSYPEPGAEHCPLMPFIEGITPAFTQHTQMAFAEGGIPFTGTPGRAHGGWVRIPGAEGPRDAAMTVALLDVWPAPALQNLRGVAMASTMSWTIHLHPAVEAPANAWCAFRAETEACADGYHAFRAWLWDDSGRPVASAMQHVAIFG